MNFVFKDMRFMLNNSPGSVSVRYGNKSFNAIFTNEDKVYTESEGSIRVNMGLPYLSCFPRDVRECKVGDELYVSEELGEVRYIIDNIQERYRGATSVYVSKVRR